MRKHGNHEYHSDDTAPRALPPVEDASDLDDQVIVADASDGLKSTDYLDELAFMNEEIEIILNRGREKHAPEFEQFGVNGRIIWIKAGVPTRIKRCYLEVMARSQPVDIRTHSGEDQSDALTFNRVERTQSAGFSFSVLKDPNPKGAAWLAKVIRES
jgi:hypothetical protein